MRIFTCYQFFMQLTTSLRLQVTKSRRLELQTLAAAGVTLVSWASAFAGIRIALRAYSPAHVALVRYAVASLVLLAYAGIRRLPPPRLRDLPGLGLVGLAGIALYNLALAYGQVSTPAATASFLIASAPIWMVLLGFILWGERPGVVGMLGILVSFLGVGVIAVGRAGLHLEPRALLLLGAALLQSVYSLGQKHFLRRYGPLQCTTYGIWAGTLALLPLGRGLPQALQTAPLEATLALIYLGLVPSVLGYVAWSYVLARISSARAGSFLYLVPALAMLIAWAGLGEVPSLVSLGGGGLVIAGVALVRMPKAQR